MKNDENQFLSPDKPQKDPEDDSFNYAPLAEKLAKSIVRMTPPEGLVLGIYGEWGLGKSTFIKFIVRYLNDMPKADQPIIVEFNPWWFAGSEHLIRHFFDQFQASLGNRGKRFVEGLIKSVKAFSDVVSEIPVPGSAVPKTIADQISDIGQRDVVTLKNDISDKLKKQNKRILVVIDDIDRLDPDEIRQVFTLIKAIADFPNVIYLVAFDKAVVAKALDPDGAEYIEKIVQVPFELPIPTNVQIRKLLLENLEKVIGKIPNELYSDFDKFFQVETLPIGYIPHIQEIVDTPRKVVRLINALRVTHSAVKGEVDPADFVAIETFRVFMPELYDEIRRRKHIYVAINQSDVTRSYFNSISSKKWYSDNVFELIKKLFPNLGSNYIYAGRKRPLQISDPQHFDTYFQLRIADDSVSISELQDIFSHANNAKLLSAQLDSFAENNPERISSLIQRLLDESASIVANENIASVIVAILEVGDRLLYEANGSFRAHSGSDESRLTELVTALLKLTTDRNQQFHILRDALIYGSADIFAIKIIIAIEDIYKRFGPKDHLREHYTVVNEESIPKLDRCAEEKVKRIVSKDNFFENYHMATVLHTWVLIEPEVAKKWIDQALQNPNNLINFLHKFIRPDMSNSNVVRLHKNIELYVNVANIAARVRQALDNSSLTSDQIYLANEFLKASDKPTTDNVM